MADRKGDKWKISENSSQTPKWIAIGTAFLGLVAGLFLAITKYYEIRKARAEAMKAELEAKGPTQKPEQESTPPHPENQDTKVPPLKPQPSQKPLPDTVIEASPGQSVNYPLSSSIQMVFCSIPGGSDRLGSPKNEAKRMAVEEDELDFSTEGFWLGKYEVTQREFAAIMGKNPSTFNGSKPSSVFGTDTSRFPVEDVSWNDVQKFLKALNDRGDSQKTFGVPGVFCLPTEYEWEYACRGGKGNSQPFYFGSTLNGRQANSDGSKPYGTMSTGPKLGRTTTVGTYEKQFPHPWGLCDMHGNVYEFCEAERPLEPGTRILKGGSFGDSEGCRAANRNHYGSPDSNGYMNVGFRVCFRPKRS